jgi:hypothetical protein
LCTCGYTTAWQWLQLAGSKVYYVVLPVAPPRTVLQLLYMTDIIMQLLHAQVHPTPVACNALSGCAATQHCNTILKMCIQHGVLRVDLPRPTLATVWVALFGTIYMWVTRHAYCLQGLARHGIRSVVFDTGEHSVGGRLGTRSSRDGSLHPEWLPADLAGADLAFDHAAQCFTATDPRWVEQPLSM